MKRLAMMAVVVLSVVTMSNLEVFADSDESAALKERAGVFWNAQVREDWAVLYDFQPVGEKEEMTREQFVSQRKASSILRYLGCEVGKIEIAGGVGWVEVSYATSALNFPKTPPEKIRKWQIWQKDEQGWYPLPHDQYDQVPHFPPSQRPAAEEALLSKRSDELWDALEKGRWDLVYEYCEPAFKGKVPPEQFVQAKTIATYLSHSVDWAEVLGDHGRVMITYTSKPQDPHLSKVAPQEDSIVEEWVKVGSTWYRQVGKSK